MSSSFNISNQQTSNVISNYMRSKLNNAIPENINANIVNANIVNANTIEVKDDVNIGGKIYADNIPPPGVLWDTAKTPSQDANLNRLYGIAWSNTLGLFAAVCYSGAQAILTSPDGYNWTQRSVNATTCICWSKEQGKFVAAGGNRTIISTDGVNWQEYNNLVGTINGIIWVSTLGKYVGVGTNTIFLSNDGITFTNIDITSLNSGFTYQRVAYSSTLNRLVAVGRSANNGRVIYSNNGGTTWQNATIPSTTQPWRAIAYSEAQSKFVALAGTGTGNLRVMTSSDGLTWQLNYDCGGSNNWHEVLYVDKHDIWVGLGPGTSGHCMISPNGIVWTKGDANENGAQNAGAYSPELDRIVGVGDGYGYPWIMVSPRLYGTAPYT